MYDNVMFRHKDIHNVVSSFYMSVQRDPLLSVPFGSVRDWPLHIERLTNFWWWRLGGVPYLTEHYNPIMKHFHAGFNEKFLSHWLKLFKQTLSDHLNEDQYDVWSELADKMGQMLLKQDKALRTGD